MVCLALILVPVAIFARGILAQSPREEAELVQVMARLFPDDRCVPPAVALDRVEKELQQPRYDAWTVRVQDGARGSPCNSAAIDASNRWVLLAPSSRPEVAAALTAFHAESLEDCMGREEIEARLTHMLAKNGVALFQTRYDGPVTFPIASERPLEELRAAALRHYEMGCYTYSGQAWSTDGLPIYFFAGDGS